MLLRQEILRILTVEKTLLFKESTGSRTLSDLPAAAVSQTQMPLLVQWVGH